MSEVQLTKQQAILLAEALDLFSLLEDTEECELLAENSPEVFEAYQVLLRITEDHEPR